MRKSKTTGELVAYEWLTSPDLTGIKTDASGEMLCARLWKSLERTNVESERSSQASASPSGGRNAMLTSVAGSMRRRGMGHPAIEAALLAENAQRCDPPLDEGEVRKIAGSVSGYAPAAPTFRTDASTEAYREIADSTAAPLDLAPSFWAARPELERLHDYALAHRVSPWAVLGCVLARVVAATPPSIVLPALIGAEASLNLFLALVGPPGSGKGAAESTGARFVDFGGVTPFDEHRPGSGQGLAHAYGHTEKPKGQPAVLMRHAVAALFSLEEADTLRGLFGQQGSTLMPELRALAMGERLGHLYVDPEKRVEIVAHSYRACLIVGVQPERAGVLLDDTAGGTPQRFVWLPTTYPHPDERPMEPQA